MSLTASERRQAQAIGAMMGANKRGIVTSYQSTPPMVKVQIMPGPPAADGPPPESGWIPYMTFATGLGGKGWSVVAPPQAGQQVLLVNEEADGQHFTAWGGYYSDPDPAPEGAGPGEILFAHESGSRLQLNGSGSISIVVQTLEIVAPNGGDAQVTVVGSISVSKESVVNGIPFSPHTHSYIPGDGPQIQTSKPEN